jgi:hypothetical protein
MLSSSVQNSCVRRTSTSSTSDVVPVVDQVDCGSRLYDRKPLVRVSATVHALQLCVHTFEHIGTRVLYSRVDIPFDENEF